MAPAYLTADCQLVLDEGRRQLRSANSRTFVVSIYGDRCFVAAGFRLWNNLLAHMRQIGTNCKQFKRLLKTFFGC